MKLWTIQTLDVWELLQSNGIFRPTLEGIPDPSFEQPYRWIANELSSQVEPPLAECQWPVWGWYQWAGAQKSKPDLRSISHLGKGTMGVRMAVEIDEGKVLLSDFDLWHYVLNYWYLAPSEQEGEEFEKELEQQGLSFYKTKPLPEPYHTKVEKSWQRIFDLDWTAKHISSPRHNKSIQAIFWELHIAQIKKVDVFKAR